MKISSHILIFFVPILLVLVSQSRPITSDGLDSGISSMNNTSVLDWHVSSVTCEPMYGFLPCSTNVWGLLFLIVVYQFLLSVGGQYVATGSNLFFQIIGPGVFGASLFQVLGAVPQIILLLVSSLSGSDKEAQNQATLGMGLVVGSTVMLLTLIWGASVVVGSYDLSSTSTLDEDSTHNTSTGFGVVTDAETRYTARIILVSLIPFCLLLLGGLHRFFLLLALIITVALFIASTLYQIFQPWVQNRRFEHLVNKYAKDKLLGLISRNGRPDTFKIKQLFDQIKRGDGSISAIELRLLLLGVRMGDDDRSTQRDVENIMAAFDSSGDGIISQDEFVKGMTKLVSDLSNQTSRQTNVRSSNNNNSTSQALLASNAGASTSKTQATSNVWSTYMMASFYVILGTLILFVISDPLIGTVVNFSQAANLSPFFISYLAIPLALNYGTAVESITSAREKTRTSISLTLSSIYSGVFMNNVIGLMVFVAPVYIRNLTANAPTEIVIVMIFSIGVNIFVSICTTFQRWVGYFVIFLYPISIACIYFMTSVLHWP